MTAPNWDQGHVLTWSGRWHISEYATAFCNGPATEARTLCGAYGYTQDTLPRYVDRLQRIARGDKPAPLCKKCEKASS